MATASGRAPVGLRNVGRDPGGFAVLNVFDLVVASVRDCVDLVDSQVLPSRCSRLREQTQVRDLAMDPVVLAFPGSVAQFAALVEVDGALEGMVRLSLVQSDLGTPVQVDVPAQPHELPKHRPERIRAILFHSTYARYRIRHGIRHMRALAGSRQRPHVPNERLRFSHSLERLRYMLIGYARVSKTDGSQSLDLQRDALRAEGIDDPARLYHDFASGVRDDRPGLDNCLRALRKGDILVVWKLDRLGRNLAHLVHTVQDLSARGVGLRVLAGQGAQIDTTTTPGRLVFGIFAALAEFERELIRERTLAGLKAARARGRKGGRKFALSKAQVRLAQAAMAHRDTSVSELCTQLGIKPVTLYRYVGPQGQLREQGRKVLAS